MMGRLLGPDYMVIYDHRQKMWLAFDSDGLYLARGATIEAAKANAELLKEKTDELRGSSNSHTEPNQTV